ncbi:Eco57I restriction-modification methylase domain-containing protein [Kineosporia babensis]|uniref:site-specific DNA-methyltransferase (adenine-specific) n=1 Tax=Kineosporia babensis TaxID=499548 RepID=A0A9X1NFM2_9ACTN|nr:N-6 DNA methylase [Kineosporia babensis]MCD5312990.1 N-6 DNA methylase [Kineosporia babensis]
MKVLYESIIDQPSRSALGEYYTPDWLAEHMVADSIADPLQSRVLDPACGSGTFIFHAIRAYLAAAAAAGLSDAEAVSGVTTHVLGIDVHPVAVTLARVTYLLAIGQDRLNAIDRPAFSIPIYLGDSLQWEQKADLLGGVDTVTIATHGTDIVDTGSGALFGDDLIFPRSVLNDATDFDRLVSAMADRAVQEGTKSGAKVMQSLFQRFGVPESDRNQLVETFETLRRLHRDERNHIWGYYVKNLIRPLWAADPRNRFDVLVGNPPWLRYNKMTESMQDRYKSLAKERQLLSGGLGASARDLSTLFVARAIELYLKEAGRFSFVMPHGTLSRKPHDGFRSGSWNSQSISVFVEFDTCWDLSRVQPIGFPMAACVVRGKSAKSPRRVPQETLSFAGRLPQAAGDWKAVEKKLKVTSGSVVSLSAQSETQMSPYLKRFRNGAILYPRRLIFVNEVPSGPISPGGGRVFVSSRTTPDDKKPWNTVNIERIPVERSRIRNVHLGETVLPYRLREPLRAVLPIHEDRIMDESDLDDPEGFARWWETAESLWEENRVPRESSSLLKRLDYHGQLSGQLPGTSNRVVYSKAGVLAAARVSDPRAVIDHKLYWAATTTVAEAQFLVGILNSQVILELVKPLMAVGLFAERDLDKNLFRVPFPLFESANSSHRELVNLVQLAEKEAASVDTSEIADFKKARRLVRDHLATQGINSRIDEAVQVVLSQSSGSTQTLSS